jgi:elongator complex protein 2
MLDRFSFVSGAEEKILRVFEAPSTFMSRLAIAHGQKPPSEEELRGRALGANAPALGLSNKAVYADRAETEEPDPAALGGGGIVADEFGEETDASLMSTMAWRPSDTTSPPFEGELVQNSLWPELAKLYGHGYELLATAASPSKDLVATACKVKKISEDFFPEISPDLFKLNNINKFSPSILPRQPPPSMRAFACGIR